MKKKKEQNSPKTPTVTVDKSLNQYKEQVLFKEKVEKANEALRTVGLPKTAEKPGT